MEVVGVVLGAVALLDPAYEGLKGLYRGYKLTQSFGEDFQLSLAGFNIESRVFIYHLELYICRFKSHGPDAIHGANKLAVMRDIAHLMMGIVNVMNECQSNIKTYDVATRSPPTPPATVSSPPSPPSSTKSKLSKDEQFAAQFMANVKSSVKKRFARARPKGSSVAHPPNPSKPLRDNTAPGVPRPSPQAEQALREWFDNGQQEGKPAASWAQLVRWADHGKDDFESMVATIKTENERLAKIIRVSTDLENPFLRIRASGDEPTLWRETEALRVELESLHMAIAAINKPSATANPPAAIPLAIKIEDNFEELKAMIDAREDIHPTEPRTSLLFSLLQVPPKDNPGRFILATPVWETEDARVDDLRAAMADTTGDEEDGAELIGVAKKGTSQRSHYHLQTLQSAELVGGHSASALATDDKFKQSERIRLAARIALAYVHFMTVKRFKSHGHLENYFLFGQDQQTDADANWSVDVVDSVWVNFGFGVPKGRLETSRGPMSKTAFRNTKIDPAVELGLMIFQVTSGTLLDYETTASGLETAREAAEKELEQVRARCGLYMNLVIETCFSTPSGDRNKVQMRILEEVADGLTKYVSKVV